MLGQPQQYGVVEMKIRYVLVGAFVAMFVVPGSAGQLLARGTMAPQLIQSAASAGTEGLFNDPDSAPTLSITLPTRFVAGDIGTPMLQSFKG
jgi:hypothetical protein